MLVLAFVSGTGLSGARAATPSHAPLNGLPFFFEANCGQASAPAQFVAHSRNATFLLGPAEVVVIQAAAQPLSASSERGARRDHNRQNETRTLTFQFVGGNAQAVMTGADSLSGKVNYLLGDDPASWRTEIPAFDRVRVAELYPGIDLVYYGTERNLEYDFTVAPGVDPGRILLRVTGAERLEVDARGDLVLSVGTTQLRQHKPILHQFIGGVRKEVTGGYQLKDSQTVTFEVGHYDVRFPLVIDPVLSYASFLGGSTYDVAWDTAVDAAGNLYLAGETLSAGLPTTTGVLQAGYAGGYPNGGGDAFVAKLSNSGSNLVYLTYLGGGGDDAAMGIAIDAAGNAYLAGLTDSPNFPLKNAIQASLKGTPSPNFGIRPFDAFVAKLNPSGSALVYSTYLGGDNYDEALAIAVDSAGSAYITGFTDSLNFPTNNPAQTNLAGTINAFVTKMNPAGTAFAYSTYLGGNSFDQGEGIAVDALGRAIVTGFTYSSNFPTTTNAIQRWPGGDQDAFLTVMAPDGKSLVRSTYLGGVGADNGYRVAVDTAGNAYVVGTEASTWSADGSFPITPGNISPGGVSASANAGSSWTRASAGLVHSQVYSLAVGSNNWLYAGTGRGVARSTDGGTTWNPTVLAQATAYGLAPPIAVGSIFALAVNPLSSATVYAGTSQGVYRSSDAGTNWTLATAGLAVSSVVPYVRAFAVDPVMPLTLYAGTSLGVFSSTNAATNWVAVSTGLYSYDVRALAIDPLAPATLYAATTYGFYRSLDRGGLWTAFNNGLTNLSCLALAIDPLTPSTLYVGTANGLFKSVDRGTNWAILPLSLAYTNGLQINAVVVNPAAPSTLYAGTEYGMFKSTDGGASWSAISNGLATRSTDALALNPGNPAQIYAGTLGTATVNTSAAFLTKFDAATGAIVASTVLGGSYYVNQGWAVAVDTNGNSFVVGATTCLDFPTTGTAGRLGATNTGANDVFVTAINSNASAFLYSVYLGGSADDLGYGIAVDPAGNAYVVGQTSSYDFPVVGAFQPAFAGLVDAFVAKIQPDAPRLVATLVGGSLQLKWLEYPPGYVLETASPLTAAATWTAVSQTPVNANGWRTVTLPASGAGGFFRLHHP